MDTTVYTLDEYISTGVIGEEDRRKLKLAAEVLAKGGLVAFPTETVYGLGGNALMPEASAKIYAAKGRPSDNPLIVHISEITELEPLTLEIPEDAGKLAAAYWPGPMTMIFRKNPVIPDATTGGLDTVAVRFPVHPVARELIRLAGVPVAAPSANLSGRPSTTTAAHCIQDLTGRVDVIIDGGPCGIGLESTIVDVTGAMPQLLRPGAVTEEMIRETLGEAVTEDAALLGPLADGVRPKAPGMKYRHYAPKAPMTLVTAADLSSDGTGSRVAERIAELLEQKKQEKGTDCKMAVLCTAECRGELDRTKAGIRSGGHLLDDVDIKILGTRADRGSIAHNLFGVLREMDDDGVEEIIAEGCGEDELGMAIMNRMKKAAAWQVEHV